MVDRPHKAGQKAGKPGKGSAKSQQGRKNRRSGSPRRDVVDRKILLQLEEEGLLSPSGRRLLHGSPSRRGSGQRKLAGQRAGKAAQEVRSQQTQAGTGPQLTEAESLVAERLHKVMARAGVASRRHSEELIQAGRVTVNGRVVTQLGTKVIVGKDIIEVDGQPLGAPEDKVYILMNKPKGYVSTLYDPQGRRRVVDLLGDAVPQRVYPVGRLDYDTEGLLLLTNDGDLANAVMHPARQVKKTYIAKVRGVPSQAKLHELENGIQLEDGPTAPAQVKLVDVKAPNSASVSIRIHEGRNRQVRRMLEAIGHEVIHLKRTTLGSLHLKDLPVGQWRELTEQEIQDLRRVAGLQLPTKVKASKQRHTRTVSTRRNRGRKSVRTRGTRKRTRK